MLHAIYFMVLSWTLLLFAPIFSFFLYRLTYAKKHPLQPYHGILLFVFFSGACAYFPVFYRAALPFPILSSMIASLEKAFGLFAVNDDLIDFLEGIAAITKTASPKLQISYSVLGILLHTVGPVLTAGIILSFFRNFFSYLNLNFRNDQAKYVFSQLNEASFVLAKSIFSKDPHSLIVFTDTLGSSQGNAKELRKKARKLNAIFFKDSITEISWSRYGKRHRLCLFLMQDDQTNMNQAAELMERYRLEQNFRLFVFTAQAESEALFGSAVLDGMRIRRIDPMRSMINHILYEDGYQIFANALDTGTSTKLISIVMVGLGKSGTEMLKALNWFCQMDGYSLRIHAFDRDPKAKSRLLATCPSLLDPDTAACGQPGDCCTQIEIHAGVDVNTAEFYTMLSDLGPVSQVYVMLGNDSANLQTAMNLRSRCERMGYHPVIQTIVRNTQMRNSLEQMRDYHGNQYDIKLMGDTKSLYSQEIILDTELEHLARKRHMKWKTALEQDQNDDRDFWAYSMNYQSSIASAIHMKMRRLCGIPGCEQHPEDLPEAQRTALEQLEHRRWMAFMRSSGYSYSGSPAPESRNDLAKLHNDMIPYQDLPNEERKKDTSLIAP